MTGIVVFSTSVMTVSKPASLSVYPTILWSRLFSTLCHLVYLTSVGFVDDKWRLSAYSYCPEAFTVASNEFKDEVEFWQEALPGHLKVQLASVCLPLPWFKTLPNLRYVKLFLVRKCFVSTERILLLLWTKMLRSKVAIKPWEPTRIRMILFSLHGLGMKFMCAPVSFWATALA